MNRVPVDTLASQALYAARLFERALHDDGPWTMTWGPHEVEVVREVSTEGVRFDGVFPEMCYLTPPEPTVVLRCAGEVMAIRAISHPGDAAFAVTWGLAAQVVGGDRAR